MKVPCFFVQLKVIVHHVVVILLFVEVESGEPILIDSIMLPVVSEQPPKKENLTNPVPESHSYQFENDVKIFRMSSLYPPSYVFFSQRPGLWDFRVWYSI